MNSDSHIIEKALDEQNKLIFESVFDMVSVPVLIARKKQDEFEHIFVNKKFAETLGYTLSDIPTPEVWFSNAYPDEKYRNEVRDIWRHEVSLDREELGGFRTIITSKTGQEKWFEAKAAIWSPQFYVVTYIDINDIDTQKRSLERLNLLKDKMLAVISHDFRSPLVTIKGLMSLLMGEKIQQEELKLLIPNIINQVNIAFNLLDDLLVWAKNQFADNAGKLTTFDISQVIHDCVGLYQHAALAKEIRLNVIPGNVDIVHTDKELVKLTVRNLLSNAIKFTQKGGEINVSYQLSGKHLLISVKDNGVGMSPQQIDSIFTKQFTIKSSGTNNEVGSGIGIILCMEALEKINGRLIVHSERGKGSEFIIELPA